MAATTPGKKTLAPPPALAPSAKGPFHPKRKLHRSEIVVNVEDMPPIITEETNLLASIKEDILYKLTVFERYSDLMRKMYARMMTFWIHPRAPYLRHLKVALALCIISQIAVIPLRMGWPYSTWQYLGFWIALDILVDIVYFFDSLTNFFVAFMEDGSSKLVTDRGVIARTYLKSKFPIHLLASLPFDLLALEYGIDSLPYLRFGKLLRTLELMPVFAELERTSGMHMIRVIGLWALFLSFAHWSGCLWFLTSKINSFDGDTWAFRYGIHNAPPMTQYIYSVYWALIVMATIGFGDILPKTNEEKIYTMFAMMFGSTVHSVVLGNISTIVAQVDAAAIRYRQKLDVLHLYMRYRNLPDFLRTRLLDYYDVSWSRHKGLDEMGLMNELPSSLRSEIALYLNTKLIQNVPLFKGMQEPGFIDSLVVMLKPQIALSGDYIIRQGEIGREMYFIVQGEVDVVSADEKVVYAVLREGSYFGEIALLFAARRIASVKARGYCDLLVLTKDDFDSVLSYFPSFADSMRLIAKQKIEEEKLKKLTKEKEDRDAFEKDTIKKEDKDWIDSTSNARRGIGNPALASEKESRPSPGVNQQPSASERRTSHTTSKSSKTTSTYSNRSRLSTKPSQYNTAGIIPRTLSEVQYPDPEDGPLPKLPPSPRPQLPGSLNTVSEASRGKYDEQRLTVYGTSDSSDEDPKQNRSFIAGIMSRVASFRSSSKYDVTRMPSPGRQEPSSGASHSHNRSQFGVQHESVLSRAEAPVLMSQNVDNIDSVLYAHSRQNSRMVMDRWQSGRVDRRSSYMNQSRNTSVMSNHRQSVFSSHQSSVMADRRQSQVMGHRFSVLAERRTSTVTDRRQSITAERRQSIGMEGGRRSSIQGERRMSINRERRPSIGMEGGRRSSIQGERRMSINRERRPSIGLDGAILQLPQRRESVRRKSRIGSTMGALPAALLALDSATASMLPADHPNIHDDMDQEYGNYGEDLDMQVVDDFALPSGMQSYAQSRRGSRTLPPPPSFSIADSFGIRRIQTEIKNDKKRMALLAQVARSDNLNDPFGDLGLELDTGMNDGDAEQQSEFNPPEVIVEEEYDGPKGVGPTFQPRRAPSVIQEEDETSRRVMERSFRAPTTRSVSRSDVGAESQRGDDDGLLDENEEHEEENGDITDLDEGLEVHIHDEGDTSQVEESGDEYVDDDYDAVEGDAEGDVDGDGDEDEELEGEYYDDELEDGEYYDDEDEDGEYYGDEDGELDGSEYGDEYDTILEEDEDGEHVGAETADDVDGQDAMGADDDAVGPSPIMITVNDQADQADLEELGAHEAQIDEATHPSTDHVVPKGDIA